MTINTVNLVKGVDLDSIIHINVLDVNLILLLLVMSYASVVLRKKGNVHAADIILLEYKWNFWRIN